MNRVMHSSLGVVCGLTLVLAACGEPTSSPNEPALRPHLEEVATQPRLLVCPSSTTQSATETIGPAGGTLAVAGARLTLPEGAVTQPTTFTLTVPASQYLQIGITADGAEHFLFDRQATIEMKYSRCGSNGIDGTNLSAWYIDPATMSLLENMNGTDDKSKRTVTFTTGHLSGYAIAQ